MDLACGVANVWRVGAGPIEPVWLRPTSCAADSYTMSFSPTDLAQTMPVLFLTRRVVAGTGRYWSRLCPRFPFSGSWMNDSPRHLLRAGRRCTQTAVAKVRSSRCALNIFSASANSEDTAGVIKSSYFSKLKLLRPLLISPSLPEYD